MLVLEVDLVPLADFDLLDVLGLLKGLLVALVVGLGALISLVTVAINRSRVGVLHETLE